MCGIVGVLDAAGADPVIVARMRDEMAHRGPDHAGIWRADDGSVCLGHQRLAIIDLDSRANQPMRSHDDRFVVTFNGEIYNFRTVRAKLEREGVAFRTGSDTEVLLEGYRRWGAGLLDLLSGQFAFAIWDAVARELFCARDRAGEKPFHYALIGGTFLFASEIKALVAWPGLPRTIDHNALIDFLTLGYVAEPKSVWREVQKLPAAHSMVVTFPVDGAPIVGAARRYWSIAFGADAGDVTGEEIRDTLLRAADEMAIADVPLGTFLSGGVDSSTVTAALSLSGHDVRSFTIGFDEAAYDERQWARQVAERYHTVHVERVVHPGDVMATIERLTWHYDEPFGDYSSFPTYQLCREARSSITVALSGDGADELFAGYGKYLRLVRRTELQRRFPAGVARVAAAAARQALHEGHRWRRTLTQYGLGAPALLADMLCIGFPLPLLRQVARGPLAEALRHYDPHRLVEQHLVNARPEEIGLVDAMRHLDLALTLPGDMLVKVDRASMANALEVRPLFLHRAVMELAARIPARSLASRQSTKLALKDAVRPWLPDALLNRPKRGFALPLPAWLGGKSAVASTIGDAARSESLAEFLDVDQLAGFRQAQMQKRGDFTQILHSSFMLDRWLARWMPA